MSPLFEVLKHRASSTSFGESLWLWILLNPPEHLAAAAGMTNKSITLVKNKNDLLPLKKSEKVLVTGPSTGKPDLLSGLQNGKSLKPL